jgi:integrase
VRPESAASRAKEAWHSDRELVDRRAGEAAPRNVDGGNLRRKRDYTMVAVLLGCGLRRAKAASLAVEHLQQREEHWVVADLVGKGGHVWTVSVPNWVKVSVDDWLTAAGVTSGPIFRAINKAQRIGKTGFSPKVIWGVVKAGSSKCGFDNVAPHDLRRTCTRLGLSFSSNRHRGMFSHSPRWTRRWKKCCLQVEHSTGA